MRERSKGLASGVAASAPRSKSVEDEEVPDDLQQATQAHDSQSDSTKPTQRWPRHVSAGVQFQAAANAVVGHLRFKKRRSCGGIDGARTELSFQRPKVSADGNTIKSVLMKKTEKNLRLLPKFGDVQFASGLMTRFCIVGPNTEPQRLFDMVIRSSEMWDLEPPKLILSIMGGAGGMNIDPTMEAHFCEGLVGAAKQTGGWVITGGTDSGVMDLVGKAMHKHDSRRTVPCIGIAPFGAMKERWRTVLDFEEDRSSDAADFMFVEAPKIRKEDLVGDEMKLAGLQQHHTHCVFVDAGSRGMAAFGTEVMVRENFEQFVSSSICREIPRSNSRPDLIKERSDLSRPGGSQGDVLRVMILVNGGPVSFKAMDNAIKHGCPVVVCDGSGRAADFVAALKLGRETDYETAWATHMTAPADKASGLQGVQGGEQVLRRIVSSSCLTVYTIEDRLEDVILDAVLQYITALELSKDAFISGLKRALELAVQWRCVVFCSRIGKALVKACGVTLTIQWILNKFAREWSEVDGGPLMKWLLEAHLEAVKRFRIHALEPPGLKWSVIQIELEEGETGSLDHLFLWLVENRAPPSVVDAVWLELEDPAHGALAGANSYREAAARLRASGGYGDASDRQRLDAMANRSEALAIRVLRNLDRIDPLEYLFRRSWRYGNHHLISLAHHLECKEFVSQQFYNQAVDTLWATPTPFAVFAFDRDPERRRHNFITAPVWDLVTGFFLRRRARVSSRDLFSVPRIKAITHGLSRALFILTYSFFVLFAQGIIHFLLSVVLLMWGVSLGLVEVLQLKAKSSFREYCTMWNILDLLLLCTLLGSILLSWTLVPCNAVSPEFVHTAHALNLLPCYARLLQIFELSEYFGTLLLTVFGMAQDTMHFLVLLGIISLGFSCSLSAFVYPSAASRWEQGVSWAFWAIFGDVALENTEQNLSWGRQLWIGFLKYMLTLTSNVLLVNLLIAMLNDTYSANKEASKREWAFNRVDAVLEFSSPDAHILPPPLDIIESLSSLFGSSLPVSRYNAEKYCVIKGVVPVGPHEVEVGFQLVGDKLDVAQDSFLTVPGEDRVLADDVVISDDARMVGKLVFTNVSLTKPLSFTFGGDRGYGAVGIVLSEDTWTMPLNRLERRRIRILQQQALVGVDAGEEKSEEKNEALLEDLAQKMTLVSGELSRVSQQLAELISDKRSNEAIRS